VDASEQRGSLALVNYIPDPLGAFLHSLRRLLPGEENPQAHITVLPPRPLQLPVESASLEARRVLDGFARFAVELSSVRRFPDTNYLYLDIVEGDSELHAMHSALNAGGLNHVERFEYRPHLTIGGPVSEGALESVQREAEQAWRASGCSPRLVVDEIVCLWLPHGGASSEWQRLWSHWLGGHAGKGAVASTTAQTS
jgi:2'-5' RNA ligase